jgi:hypothetical protein
MHCVTQGHSVVFSHDVSEQHLEEAIKLIEQDQLQSLLSSVLFVGPKGKMDWLTAKTKGSSTILMGRAFIAIQWLLLLQQSSRCCFYVPEKISDPTNGKRLKISCIKQTSTLQKLLKK